MRLILIILFAAACSGCSVPPEDAVSVVVGGSRQFTFSDTQLNAEAFRDNLRDHYDHYGQAPVLIQPE